MKRPYKTFKGPKQPVTLLIALRLCRLNRLWCFRPVSLHGSGNGIAWRVVDGMIVPMDDAPTFTVTVETMLGRWEVLAVSTLEREEHQFRTGVE